MDEEIFKISKNIVRANALRELAQERFDDIKKETKPYKIIEQYYEVIKELITSIMYLDGFKTLSHKALIYYLEENYGKYFSKDQFILMDEARRLRNDIGYYGKKVDSVFLANNEKKMKEIISKLVKLLDERLSSD